MKTPLFILLQATGGIRNEVNTFLSDYAVPVIAMLPDRGEWGSVW